MSSSSTLSKVKVGRQWGYPIIVTTGKSKHEAILLDCNTDNPQDFLKQNAEVKIRWKVAMYNESVPASNVVLQNVDTSYNRSRKAAVVAVDSTKKRKTNASIENPSAVTSSGIKVKEEEVETDNDEDSEKPDEVPSNANVKEEEVETDNDDDNEIPVAVPSANVKEEEVETDDEDKKPAAVTSGIAVKTEEIETDDDEEEDDRKPQAVTSSDVAIKTEEVETDDEEDNKQPDLATSSAVKKEEEIETDDDEDESKVDTGSGSASGLTEEQRKERRRNIKLHLALIEHASRCTSETCSSSNCQKMKSYLKHKQVCKINASGGCRTCKRVSTLLRIHAQGCKISNCPMPECVAIRKRSHLMHAFGKRFYQPQVKGWILPRLPPTSAPPIQTAETDDEVYGENEEST